MFIAAFFFFLTPRSAFLDLGVGPLKDAVILYPCVCMVLWDHVNMRLFGAPYAYFIFLFPPPPLSCRSSYPKSGHPLSSRANPSPNQRLVRLPAPRSVAGGTREPGPWQTSRPEPSKPGPSARRRRLRLWQPRPASSQEPWGAQERAGRPGPWRTSKSRRRPSSLLSIKREPTSSRIRKNPGGLPRSAQRKGLQA